MTRLPSGTAVAGRRFACVSFERNWVNAAGGLGCPAVTTNPPKRSDYMKTLLKKLVCDEQGQDVIEYALLAAAISVIAIPVVPGIGTAILARYTGISTQVGLIPTP